ncbi:MAG: ATP-binding region ATPase domain protein [Ilumatobacteraceae bacterium]|nr:ATP-binding region ATPase domain protein [Ilumatobacteraceae bacterium]
MPVDMWVHRLDQLHAMRRAIRQFVEPVGMIADDVTLAANELATNALVYAGAPCHVSGQFVDAAVRFGSTDGAPAPLQLFARPAPAAAVGGRGLAIVQRVASRWGVEPVQGGKTVWFEVDVR